MSNKKIITGVLIFITILGLLAAGVYAWQMSKGKEGNSDLPQSNSQPQSQNPKQNTQETDRFIWQQTANGWQAMETPPTCPEQPMLKAPTDLTKVTSVLYPGQTRGSYKPHGGLRFDNSTDNKITVRAPFDGYIVKATRNFAEGTTEVQYGFDIMSNCGVMTRFGHLRELPANLQQIVDKLPEPRADSRIENVMPPVYIKQGDILATKVGLISQKNTFFDWGVYDYRQQNEASKSPKYKADHPQGEHAWYAVCWLEDWISENDAAILNMLPAGDGKSVRQSDYCEI